MFEIHNFEIWVFYDKNCWFYESAELSYCTLKMAFESRGQNVTWNQSATSVCVLEIFQHLPDLPPWYLHQKFLIKWRNYSIQNHLTFSLPLNFSSVTKCKQTRTHKLTSQHNKFGSSLLTIFEGKIAQLCMLVKSTIFIVDISNFGTLCISNVRFWNYVEIIFAS